MTNRREFIGKIGKVAATGLAFGTLSKTIAQAQTNKNFAQVEKDIVRSPRRARRALEIRENAALRCFQETNSSHPTNGDEQRYANKIGNFSKALPHNAVGEVDINAYNALLRAVTSGKFTDFSAITLGGTVKLANPQAAFAFSMDSGDSQSYTIPAPPNFASEETAAEITEVYWQALTRDIPFSEYATNPMIASAVADLRRFSKFSNVNVSNIFRGETVGDLVGPYISQFLYKPIPHGALTIEQKYDIPLANVDFMTSNAEWLRIQNGNTPSQSLQKDPIPRYLRNGRDLGEWVHTDYSYQGFVDAALILLAFGSGALANSNPYKTISNQGGFVHFGGPHILDMVARVALLALKAAWYQKWCVHRRLRPEEFAGQIHLALTGNTQIKVHQKLTESSVLELLASRNGSYFLPMAFAEGCPTHPAYPAGHATIAGACVTILKAFFKESFVIPNPVFADNDGFSLTAYNGNLTVGGELNKLAANISIGRDIAGVHWRSDGIEGMNLGEQVAISLLKDYKETYNENFAGFSFTRFNGSTITI